MKARILQNILEMLAGIGTFIVARWILELSSPVQDLRMLTAFFRYLPMYRAIRWYRGIEYIHQLRGVSILKKGFFNVSS